MLGKKVVKDLVILVDVYEKKPLKFPGFPVSVEKVKIPDSLQSWDYGFRFKGEIMPLFM